MTQSRDIEVAVKDRYAKGAEQKEEALCCPVSYNPEYLKVLPEEILEKDYGCGDPSAYLQEGDVVLDLGSGAGKICYIASQIVGPSGKVIGVDFNPTMLELARKYQRDVGSRIGWHNTDFRWGKIQDLKTDLSLMEKRIQNKPIGSMEDYLKFENESRLEIQEKPLIESDSIDVIVSNCVLNLVRSEDKRQLFKEMYRVLKKGGRIAISDIVSDEVVPEELQRDEELWSGCISGAFQEKEFLKAFEDAGFYGIKIEKWDEKPWQVVNGIEFRSVTVTGYKGKEGACWERNQAVIYKGPWKQVVDDDKHVLKRGVRTAVCDKTFQLYSKAPYRENFIFVEPQKEIPLSEAEPFNCKNDTERDPRISKGAQFTQSEPENSTCLDSSCC